MSGIASELGSWWWAIIGAALAGPLLCLLPWLGPPAPDARPGRAGLARRVPARRPEGALGPAGDPVGFAFNMRYAAPALTLSLAILPLAPVLDGPPADSCWWRRDGRDARGHGGQTVTVAGGPIPSPRSCSG